MWTKIGYSCDRCGKTNLQPFPGVLFGCTIIAELCRKCLATTQRDIQSKLITSPGPKPNLRE